MSGVKPNVSEFAVNYVWEEVGKPPVTALQVVHEQKYAEQGVKRERNAQRQIQENQLDRS